MTVPGSGRFAVAVEVLGDPGIPVVALDGSRASELLRFHLGTQRPSLDRFGRNIGSQFRGFVPALSISVDELDEPERRAFSSVDRGHFLSAVSAVNLLHSDSKTQLLLGF